MSDSTVKILHRGHGRFIISMKRGGSKVGGQEGPYKGCVLFQLGELDSDPSGAF